MPQNATSPAAELTRRQVVTGAAAGGMLLAVSGELQAAKAPDAKSAATDVAGTTATPPAEWTALSPRDEIRPRFSHDPNGGPGNGPAFVIEADDRPGLNGCWRRTFSVTGGRHYRFGAVYHAENVEVPRRSIVARLDWTDAEGRSIPLEAPAARGQGSRPMAETEFPATHATRADGWTEISDTYLAPPKAARLVVQLHLQWCKNASVKWAELALTDAEAAKPRVVRLATAHLRPWAAVRGKSPMESCRAYEPLIAEAAKQRADLIVLGEVCATANLGLRRDQGAEPIPDGPSTRYFAELAKKHNLYIVPSLLERDGPLLHNTAVLIGPEGVVGKYRKVCPTRGEAEGGIEPGTDYPVFQTRFGKVAMMICYDGFFPEVARELSNRGAEVIAWPVWGCNPLLARARACENHVYVVSSTYTDASKDWMVSAVFDRTGEIIAKAEKFGTIAVAEVDLNSRTRWPSLGDFRAEIPHHRPLGVAEPRV